MKTIFCTGLILLSGAGLLWAATAQELVEQSEQAYREGKHEVALRLASEAIAAEPKNFRWLNHRGSLHFRLGRIEESIRDFDAEILLAPDRKPHHWQRGISYYYMGQFKEGRDQFELHQKVNPQDVENAVWHFLCAARLDGVEKARPSLIPITSDTRIPMMKVHDLFAGKATPEDVLKAANAGEPDEEELRSRLFFAHLYLGLYYEALGDGPKVRTHMDLASGRYAQDHYMGDVARVHAERLKAPAK